MSWCDGAISWIKIQVIHNTIDSRKKLFPSVFYMFWNWLSNLYHSQKGPFYVTQAKTITFFYCLLNIIFIFKSQTKLLWGIKGTFKVKSFSSYHSHFLTKPLFLNLSAKAPVLFGCLVLIPKLIMVVCRHLKLL